MKGTGMAGEIIIIFAVVVGLAAYGIWKYTKSEMSDYQTFVTKAGEIEASVKALDRRLTEFQQAKIDVDNCVKKMAELQLEVDKAQDHYGRLRESLIQLQDRVSRKRPVLQYTQPIQVQVVDEKKALLKKTKKQIEGLSQ